VLPRVSAHNFILAFAPDFVPSVFVLHALLLARLCCPQSHTRSPALSDVGLCQIKLFEIWLVLVRRTDTQSGALALFGLCKAKISVERRVVFLTLPSMAFVFQMTNMAVNTRSEPPYRNQLVWLLLNIANRLAVVTGVTSQIGSCVCFNKRPLYVAACSIRRSGKE